MIQLQITLGAVQTNCYIIVDETSGMAAVVDPGDFKDCLADLLKHPAIKSVQSILLTHGHFDHILGVKKLKDYTGAKVCIHSNDAGCLEDSYQSLAYHLNSDAHEYVKPDVLLEDNRTFYIGSIKIRTIHTPGHTPGSVCFVCEHQKTIFTGDTLFRMDVGRTDFPGGSRRELIKSLLKLSALDGDYKIFPGHDRPTTLDYERRHNTCMRAIE